MTLHVSDWDAVGDAPDGVQVQQGVSAPGEDIHVRLVGQRDLHHLGVPALLGEEASVQEGRHLLGHVLVEVAHPAPDPPGPGHLWSSWLVIKLY